jgi:hypothetical protein
MPRRKLSIDGSDKPEEVLQTFQRNRIEEPTHSHSEAEEEDTRKLWDFLQKHHDFRLTIPAASKKDLLGLTDLKLITSFPKPSPTSLYVISKLHVSRVDIHFDCRPSDPAKLFEYVWQALIPEPKSRKYNITIRVLSLLWD